jgi:hypothetical protein
MKSRCLLLILATTLLSSVLLAAEWWEKKPYTEWSQGEVNRMLSDSPWVRLALKDRRWNYRITLLSSRAVRDALLCRFSLSGPSSVKLHAGQSVTVEQLRKENDEAGTRIRIEKFIAENPNDIRVKGDARHIVLAISQTTNNLRWQGLWWRRLEDMRPTELLPLQLEELAPYTQLTTKTGRTIPLVDYEPPGRDMLGARLYFPRYAADGSPAVTIGDRELLFETRIAGRKIKVKFDLKKLMYQGNFEI